MARSPTTSVTLFIIGFVTLTSFTESMVLMKKPVSGTSTNVETITIRPISYSTYSPSYISDPKLMKKWLDQQPEINFYSEKLETSPGLTTEIFHNPGKKYYEDQLDYNALKEKYGPNVEELIKLHAFSGYIIQGYLSVNPYVEDNITDFSNILNKGSLPMKGGILIGESLENSLKLELGDIITIRGKNYTVDGVFSESTLGALRDIDDSTYLPWGTNDLDPTLDPDRVFPMKILIFNFHDAINNSIFKTSRYAVNLKDGYDSEGFARKVSLEIGYSAYLTNQYGVTQYKVDKTIESKGFQLTIPWIIIILNVTLTIINSMYERKREVKTLSSLGVNPTQIAVIFLIEASIIGLIGGSLGYVAGTSMYKIMSIFGFEVGMHQKISSFWTIASIILASVSSLAGAIVALRTSTVITPSHWRRWQYLEKADGYEKPLIIDIPVKIDQNRAEEFAEYMLKTLKSMDSYYHDRKTKLDNRNGIIRIPFVYTIPHTNITSKTYTSYNVLIIDKTQDTVAVTLESKGEMDSIRTTGNLIRTQAMRWSPDKNSHIEEKI